MITLSKVAALQAESKSALGAFEKTLSRLNKVNGAIVKAKEARYAKIAKLNDELNAPTGAETRNVKVASKISSFLED